MTEADERCFHGRLPWYRPDELTREQRDYYDRLLSGPRDKATLIDVHGRLKGLFNARLLDPRLGTVIEQTGAVLRFATPALSGRQRETTILEVARFERSGYEWAAHARAAQAAGLRAEEIDAILRGDDAGSFSDDERLTRRVVRALTERRDLSDELYAAAADGLGLVALFDIISLVGHYQHTALALRVWRVPDDRPGCNPFSEQE